jgi:hypothetical protein
MLSTSATRRLGALALGLSLTWATSRSAHAQGSFVEESCANDRSQASLELRYDAHIDQTGCPAELELRARVTRQLGYDPFLPPVPEIPRMALPFQVVSADIHRTPSGELEVILRFLDAAGETVFEPGPGTTGPETCESLLTHIVHSVEYAIARYRPSPAQAGVLCPAKPSLPKALPSPSQAVREQRPIDASPGLGVLYTQTGREGGNGLASPGIGVAARVNFHFKGASWLGGQVALAALLEVGLQYFPAAMIGRYDMRRAAYFSFAAVLCVELARVYHMCVVGRGGRLSFNFAAGDSILAGENEYVLNWALGPRLGFMAPLDHINPKLSLGAHGDLLFLLSPAAFEVNGHPVWQDSRQAFSGGLDANYKF